MLSDVAAVAAVVISLASLLISLSVQKAQRTRQDFELARSLHHDLTTGEVAGARDILGTVVRSEQLLDDERRAEVVRVYFTLLWCFERIKAGRDVMGRGRPRRFLDEAIRWHVREWEREIGRVKYVMEGRPDTVDDDHSREGLRELARVV